MTNIVVVNSMKFWVIFILLVCYVKDGKNLVIFLSFKKYTMPYINHFTRGINVRVIYTCVKGNP